MKVLVDTCVWSKVLRYNSPDLNLSSLLRDLVLDNRVVLVGPIVQEILSGVKGKKEFHTLNEKLKAFDLIDLSFEVYAKAAEYFNICKAHGLNGGHIDFLLCAAVNHYEYSLLTIDEDFKAFQKYLPIKLFN